jgi:wyosine [tRNA(Phe)-imidazoG37] synthetase (radical SAM superfamily)
LDPLKSVFSEHPRRWRDFRYVYPVISRRSRGLSIGINLNPDAACNFDCVYCCADRTVPRRVPPLELAVLEAELRHMVEHRRELFAEPEFRAVPHELRRLNDIAFSGDGEPTLVPAFPQAAALAIQVRQDYGLDDTKLVLITNGCCLARPAVAETLALLDQHNGQIWAKLDAGTEEYFQQISRTRVRFQAVLDSLRAAARIRPIVLQSLFMRLHDQPPPAAEIAAYAQRVRWLLEGGGRISLIQIYTVARRTAEAFVSPLTPAELEAIAAAVRPLGVPAEVFP